jgi:hypothetical protein
MPRSSNQVSVISLRDWRVRAHQIWLYEIVSQVIRFRSEHASRLSHYREVIERRLDGFYRWGQSGGVMDDWDEADLVKGRSPPTPYKGITFVEYLHTL